jgi:hypothetical protein
MDVDVTLPGIAPLLDRPSVVDDDAWDVPDGEVDDDKTALCEVPIFKLPKRLRIERLRIDGGVHPLVPAPVASSVALPPIPRPKEAVPPRAARRRGLVLILIASIALAAGLAVAGMTHRNLWLPALQRVLSARQLRLLP